jgi:hypothetical protein
VAAMLEHYHMRTLNARQFCEAMHFAGEAGIEQAKPYGKAPGAASGHYQRHLDQRIGRMDFEPYEIKVPGHGKHDLSRTTNTVLANVAHEAMAEDMAAPTFSTRLRECLSSDKMPSAYWEHPIVKANPSEDVAPFALYVDGVPYSLTDSIIGYWLICLVTGKRYLLVQHVPDLCIPALGISSACGGDPSLGRCRRRAFRSG